MSDEYISEHGFKTTRSRSKVMKQIGSKDTKPEIRLRKTLWHEGIRYRTNYKQLPGNPDIAITKNKLAVFVDGDFWHGYNWKQKKKNIQSNRDYWIPKIEGNMERDQRVNKKLEKLDWEVIRFWEHEVKNSLEECVLKVKQTIKELE